MRRALQLVPRRAIAVLALAVAAVAGCSTDGPLIPDLRRAAVPPAADSPTALVQRFQWAYSSRDPLVYRGLFTADYVFQFGLADPYGNAYRDASWAREDELVSARNLFTGGSATEQPANRISLDITNALRAVPDIRAGKDSTWHRCVSVDVLLSIGSTTLGDLEIRGTVVFYVVRGDSASIPGDLGLPPDSTRWYIERWEDYTVQAGAAPARLLPAAHPLPTSSRSWGSVKVLYR